MENYTFIALNDFFELGLQNVVLSSKKSFIDHLINFKSSTLFSSNFIIEYFNNLILIFFFYYILKLIILSSIVELLWPTHFFNKKNNIFKNKIKYRLFSEYFLKTYSKSTFLITFNFIFLN